MGCIGGGVHALARRMVLGPCYMGYKGMRLVRYAATRRVCVCKAWSLASSDIQVFWPSGCARP